MIHSFFDKTFKAVLLLILLSFIFVVPLFIVVQPDHPTAISEGWQYRYGDVGKNAKGIPIWVYDKLEDSNWKSFSYPGQPPAKPGSGDVWLRTQLPTTTWETPSIMFTTNDQLFEIYLEDKLIYTFGNVEKYNDKIAPGSPWHIIRLPEGYQGKTVYLRMHTPFDRNIGLVRKFEIGSENEHMAYLIANEIDNMLLTCLFAFLGFCLILIHVLRRSVNYEFSALGVFSISIALWLLAETNFKQLFLDAPRFWFYVAFLSFYLMPVGFMIFVEKIFSPGNIYMRMMLRLNIYFAVFTLLLDVTRLVPFIFTLQAFYVVLFLSVVIIFATIAKAARGNTSETKIFIYGFSIFLLFGFYDILGMYFRIVPWSQYIIPYGMFIFLLSMIFILGKRVAAVYDKQKLYLTDIKAKNEALNQAYKEVSESENKLSEWNKDLEITIQKRTASIKNLLDNAGQGFLTFGAGLLIGTEFSSECQNIFNCNIGGKPFDELIYPDNAEERDFLTTLFSKILDEEDEAKRNVYFSLLPAEVSLNNKHLQLSYKIIADIAPGASVRFMVILTDITYKHLLESKVEQERNVLKMVVKIVTNNDDFIDTIKDYKGFCRYKLPEILNSELPLKEVICEICRTVHTFKGTFSLFDMSNIIKSLHDFETEMSACNNVEDLASMNKLKEYILQQDFESWLKADMDILSDILGDKFFIKDDVLVIEKDRLKAIEEKMLLLLPTTECRLLLPDVLKLRQKPFKEVLKGLPHYAENLADRMDKLINPIEIHSDNILVDLDIYQSFSKALIHVFRNIIDHGLETVDERLDQGKPEKCSINCEIKLVDNAINMIISDDGRGFDFDTIKQKIIDMGLLSEEIACSLEDNETIQFMIDNHISTKSDVTYTSGRGLGLSIVKNETEKLGGTFGIIAVRGKGTSFLFRLPYEATEQIQDLEASSILDPLAETAKEFIADKHRCKILNVSKYSSSKLESILLKDFTSLIGIKGVFCGKFVITIDRLLAEKLLKNIIIGELNEEDICLYIEDVLAESSNIIIGNSIKKFMGLEDQIVMEPPIAIELPNAVMRFISSSAWSCSLESEYGNIVISLIVPNNSCFGLSC